MSADTATCIVLAGGLGTRLRQAVPDRPKCLAPVGTSSFLELQLLALLQQGFTRFVLSLGYMAGQVAQAARSFDAALAVECVVETHPLGTGGAVLHAMDSTGLRQAVVINGDTMIDADLAAMRQPLSQSNGEHMRIGLVTVADRERYGGVRVEQELVVGFSEKGQSGPGLINAGIYRVDRQAFDGWQPGVPLSMEAQVMPALMVRGALRATSLKGSFIDIGIPDDYRRFCASRAGTPAT